MSPALHGANTNNNNAEDPQVNQQSVEEDSQAILRDRIITREFERNPRLRDLVADMIREGRFAEQLRVHGQRLNMEAMQMEAA